MLRSQRETTWHLSLQIGTKSVFRNPAAAESRFIPMLLVMLSATCGVSAAFGPGAAPMTLGWDGAVLATLRRQIKANSIPPAQHTALNALRREARSAQTLSPGRCPFMGPWAVTSSNQQLPPSGDLHDLMSFGTYSWPCNMECNQTLFGAHPNCSEWWARSHKPKNCDNATGLPWVGHDGFHNNGAKQDEDCGIQMADTVMTLALASYLFDEETYLYTAALVVNTWFINAETRMNPNMQYAAIKPPPFNGTSGGIIFTPFRWNSNLIDSVELIATASNVLGSDVWTAGNASAWRNWNSKFLPWLTESYNGKNATRATNNHHTWLAVSTITLALSTGSTAVAEEVVSSMLSATMPGSISNQILPGGEMPNETKREDSISYDTMNIRGLLNLVAVASHTRTGADRRMWDFKTEGSWGSVRTSASGSIHDALDFLLPFARGQRHWPYQQVNDDNSTWTALAPQLRQAAILTGNKSYEDAIAALPWPAGDWPSAWEMDVAQFLWPLPKYWM